MIYNIKVYRNGFVPRTFEFKSDGLVSGYDMANAFRNAHKGFYQQQGFNISLPYEA